MKKEKNVVWRFFASVKLALFSLFVLAVASIIGTIVPQNEAPFKYVELYGANVAKFFQILDIPDMYSSVWFVSLLSLFSLNLVVCTIERFPHIWKVVTNDNLATNLDRLNKMPLRQKISINGSPEQAIIAVCAALSSSGWKKERKTIEGGTLFFSQKGAWTRLAVFIVHTSILVIFIGALIGTFFGYKASVMIPEGGGTNKIYQSNQQRSEIPLGFLVRCNNFSLTYYDTGAPKEFRSDLVVEKDGKVLTKKSIIVNDPLQYGGLTFYQSSYQPMDGQFTVSIKNENSGAQQRFGIVPRQEMKWAAENLGFGVTAISAPDFMGRYRYKIWFSDGVSDPVQFWADEGVVADVKRSQSTYQFMIKKRFATGLQVVKDPGVWTVYIGCMLMIIGLVIIFFMSHRRVWIYVSGSGETTNILLCGSSNKNKIGFEKDFDSLLEGIEEHKGNS